jgi:SAM-dependent methyltransferase
VLDVCCGNGRHLAALSALGYETTGIERDPAVAWAAREAAPLAHVVEGDAHRLPELVVGPFGGVVCMWQSFGYGTPSENAALLGAMAVLLVVNGRLVLDVFNRAFFESRTGSRTMERDGRSIRERIDLEGDRLTTTLDYGSGIEDVFSWQVFTLDELVALARSAALAPVLACATFDEAVPPSAEHPRMQLVFLRRGGGYS